MENTTEVLSNNFYQNLLVNKKYKFLRHGICLLTIGLIACNGQEKFMQPYDTYVNLVMFTILVSLFYVNMYLLVPGFLLQNKFLSYGLLVLAHTLISYLLMSVTLEQAKEHLITPIDKPRILIFFVLQMTLATASTAVKLAQRWISDTEKIYTLEKLTIQSELEQLRNQITPHFLFNMLNNANVLTQKDPVKASEVLMRLSDILRYQLYDSAMSKVLLTAEIHFVNDFLNLEKVRRDKFTFMISKEGELSGIQVPPMLFITFVENAVKHNGDPEKASYVHVYFYINNNRLTFKCINSIPEKNDIKPQVGGLGLINIKRRLELLYPGRYHLDIKESYEPTNSSGSYCVELTIDL